MASGQQTENIRLNGSGAGSQLVLDHPSSYSVKSCSTGTAALSAVAGSYTSAAETGGTANAMAKVVLTQWLSAGQQPRMDLQGSLYRSYIARQSV